MTDRKHETCPTCGSSDRELYLPKCQGEYWSGSSDPWHTQLLADEIVPNLDTSIVPDSIPEPDPLPLQVGPHQLQITHKEK